MSKFKVGDKVRCNTPTRTPDSKAGDEYTVVAVGPWHKADDEQHFYALRHNELGEGVHLRPLLDAYEMQLTAA